MEKNPRPGKGELQIVLAVLILLALVIGTMLIVLGTP